MITNTTPLGQRMQSALDMTNRLMDEIAPDLMAHKLQAVDGRTTVRVLQVGDDPGQVAGILYAPGGLSDEEWSACIREANACWAAATDAMADGDLSRLSVDIRKAMHSGNGIAALVVSIAAQRGHSVAVVNRDAWRTASVV